MRILVPLVATALAAGATGCDIDRFLPDLPAADTGVDAAAPDAGEQDGGTDAEDGGVDDVAADTRERPEVDATVDVADEVFFDPDVTPSIDIPVPTDPPLIDVVYPTSLSTQGGQVVVVEGARFALDVEIRVGGIVQDRFDLIDQYELAFVTQPMPPGVHELKITTGAGSANWPGGLRFTDPLRVDAAAPNVLPAGRSTEVVVQGAGFGDATRFVAGSRSATVLERRGDGEVVVMVEPGAAGTSGDLWAHDDEVAVLREAFTWRSSPAVRALVPSRGLSAGGERVRIDGEGIDADCSAWLGGRAVRIDVGPDGWPGLETPGGPVGPVDLSVDCGARGSQYVENVFRYVEDGGRSIDGVWPPVGFERGGEVVSVTGNDLEGAARVRFDGAAATILARTPRVIDVLLPPGTAGTADVTVDFGGSALTSADLFRYVAEPGFEMLEPASGPSDAGWSTVVRGTGLDGVDAFILDGVSLSATSGTTTSATLPVVAGAEGTSDLRARIGPLVFDTGLDVERLGARRFDAFSPREGALDGGTVLYVVGAGLGSSCVVTVDGVAVPTSARGGSLLAAILPPHEEGSATIGVEGCGEAFTFSQPFRYVDPTRLPGGVGGGELRGELRVSVREFVSGAPIAGATVQVRARGDGEYLGLTDDSGLITFRGEDLVGPQVITAFAPERSAETYFNTSAAEVTLMLNPLPPPPCEPGDPACAPPPPPPVGEIIGFLTGLRKVVDPPPGTVLAARLETTRQAAGYINPDPGPDAFRYEEGAFRITSRLGDVALIALCGYEYVVASGEHPVGEFVPLTMGVVRRISLREGDPYRTAIDCNIPLRESLAVKLTGAPELPPGLDDYSWPGAYRARLVFDFGGEGFFESLPGLRFTTGYHVGGAYPPLTGDLAGVRFDVIAGVYPRIGNLPSSESYARRVAGYETTVEMPALLAVPVFTFPTLENPRLVDGYVEWRMGGPGPAPSLYSISVSSGGAGFPRWSIFVPGSATSFHLTDFAPVSDVFGEVPIPGDPAGSFTVYIRAIAMDVFSFDSFDRYALRSRNWRATSTAYRTMTLATGPAPETPASP